LKNEEIGYLSFGRDDFSYGMALCLNSLPKENLFRVTSKTAKYVDWLLFSCFWWEHIYLLADFLRKAGIRKGDTERPKIIVGGFNTFNPVPFQAYADYVVCGDGEEILPKIIEGKESPPLEWLNVDPLRGFLLENQKGIARIEIARGCKFRCHFCAVSHLKPYREVPFDEVYEQLKKTKSPRVSCFSPEPTLHSRNDEITDMCHRLGKHREDSDVRLDRISKKSDAVPRVGIEGLSERLRKSIGKPYEDEQIIEAIDRAIKEKRKGIFLYFILDLPGETEEDWMAFHILFKKIDKIPGIQDFVVKPSPSVFLPNPHTPMEFDGIHWDRPYQQKWINIFHGKGKRDRTENREWEMILTERSRVFSPANRVLCMISTRAGEEFSAIEEELSRKKAIQDQGGRVKCVNQNLLIRVLTKYGGVDHYCGGIDENQKSSTPWKKLIVKSK
jgi:hypothetical protein